MALMSVSAEDVKSGWIQNGGFQNFDMHGNIERLPRMHTDLSRSLSLVTFVCYILLSA